ncbi:Uncharacterised protein [Chlamydia trachomatis]|nr:Uncharacterised protein [Chlamydia trachomatis]
MTAATTAPINPNPEAIEHPPIPIARSPNTPATTQINPAIHEVLARGSFREPWICFAISISFVKVFIELEFEVQLLGRVVIESPLNDRHADGPKNSLRPISAQILLPSEKKEKDSIFSSTY